MSREVKLQAKLEAAEVVEHAKSATMNAVTFLDGVVRNQKHKLETRVNAAGKLLGLGWADAPKQLQVETVSAEDLTTEQKLLVLQRASQLLPLLRGDVSDAVEATGQGDGNGRDTGQRGEPEVGPDGSQVVALRADGGKHLSTVGTVQPRRKPWQK